MEDTEDVYIGSKSIGEYITAGFWALNQDKNIRLLGRGNNTKTTIDVAEILKRKIEDPEVEVEIGSEEFEDRKVSTIEITLKGDQIKEE